MADRTIRTIGATTILVGLAIAGFIQVSAAQEEPPPEIVVADESTTSSSIRGDSRPDQDAPEDPMFEYRIGVLAGISTDNFWSFYGEEPSVWNSYILGPTKPALMSFDPVSGGVVEELADTVQPPSWDEDGWRIRISLRDDFKWSDGVPVTAHDIVFTFETVRSLGLGGSWASAYPLEVESMHADSDYDLRIEFEARPTLSVWPHAVGTAPIMPAHVWADGIFEIGAEELYQLSGDEDVGGGRLALVDHDENTIVSARNPGYPYETAADRVVYRIYSNEVQLVEAMQAGEIDTAITPEGLSAENTDRAMTDPEVEVVSNVGHGVRYLAFNLNRAPMADSAFRNAIGLLLDREELASGSDVTGLSAHSFVPAANRLWFDQEKAAGIAASRTGTTTERLETVLGELSSIGYTWETEPAVDSEGNFVPGVGLLIDGQPPAPLTILTPGDSYDPSRPKYVEGIAKTIEVLGFDVRPVETDFDTVVDLAFTPTEEDVLQYDMYVLGWTLGSPAFPLYYRPLFATDGDLNNTGYSSKRFDRLLSSYEAASTLEDARSLLWKMEEQLAEDLPYVVLYHSQISEAYRADQVSYAVADSLGGLQARLGGLADVRHVD